MNQESRVMEGWNSRKEFQTLFIQPQDAVLSQEQLIARGDLKAFPDCLAFLP